MKILLVNKDCQIAGTEAFMVGLSAMIHARGHHCELFFFEHGPMQQHLPADCPVHFGDLADCMKLVRSRNFDLVHANSSDVRIGIAAVRSAGAKLVITAHGMVVPAWNSTNCDALVSCSRWQVEEQKLLTDLPVHTVMNGIDIDKFTPSNSVAATAPPIVAWVGRGIDMVHKRIDKLAGIAPLLHEAGVRLWLADPYGPEKVAEVVPGAVRTLEPLVEFWDKVPKEDLPGFYQKVAASGGCLLSTSIREGFGLALAEAQGCGCPVIGADVRGVNEVVRPEHGGVLYPFAMPDEELANLVLDTINDKEGMRWRRARCVEFVREHFGLKRMAEDYLRIYEEVLNSARERKSVRRAHRRRLAAVALHWQEYVERSWSAGRSQYEASKKLAAQGEWELAAAAARLSALTCPTLYARPERLAHLAKALFHTSAFPNKRQVAK